ncbi:hypothetical protein C0989_003865 [Termitomyces sp. Mn162]|nr:hypothetical protein C0989_003865 [Termitomyces sp. Mn162]
MVGNNHIMPLWIHSLNCLAANALRPMRGGLSLRWRGSLIKSYTSELLYETDEHE